MEEITKSLAELYTLKVEILQRIKEATTIPKQCAAEVQLCYVNEEIKLIREKEDLFTA